ncbi:hypothetical protein ABLE91_10990 [Aquabacter sp. CN5-332]|uniref:hypothetical protein n=1 Tax=Aquabacter sp. CN5-332 TaxID=3156608 RepID=UPI0032B44DD4
MAASADAWLVAAKALTAAVAEPEEVLVNDVTLEDPDTTLDDPDTDDLVILIDVAIAHTPLRTT